MLCEVLEVNCDFNELFSFLYIYKSIYLPETLNIILNQKKHVPLTRYNTSRQNLNLMYYT